MKNPVHAFQRTRWLPLALALVLSLLTGCATVANPDPRDPLESYNRRMTNFNEQVDALVLSEVYPAGETPIAGADAKSLARAIRARGRNEPVVVSQVSELAGVLPNVLQDGDLLLLMGAGDIGHVAQQIAAQGFEGNKPQ